MNTTTSSSDRTDRGHARKYTWLAFPFIIAAETSNLQLVYIGWMLRNPNFNYVNMPLNLVTGSSINIELWNLLHSTSLLFLQADSVFSISVSLPHGLALKIMYAYTGRITKSTNDKAVLPNFPQYTDLMSITKLQT